MSDFPARLLALQPFWNTWCLDSLLGEGSYGKVYKIYREEFGSRFYSAMKWIPLPARQDEIDRMRSDGMSDNTIKDYYDDCVLDMQNEIKLMSSLRGTSHVVSFEDHAFIRRENGIGWDILIRMELLTPLSGHVNKMTVGDVVRMGIDLCDALSLCEKHRIVHRDIKPDNIFISENGDYKLGDFGVARSIQKDLTGLSMKGTPMYMTPEIYQGKLGGVSADQYSLGLVMYKLLNAQQIAYEPTYSRVQTNTEREAAFYRRMKGDPLPSPLQGSTRLKEIILKACSYHPQKRFSSPEAFRRALESVLDDPECAQPLRLIDSDTPPLPPESRSFPRANRYPKYTLIAASSVILLILLGVLVLGSNKILSSPPVTPIPSGVSETQTSTYTPTPTPSPMPSSTPSPTSVPTETPLPLGWATMRSDVVPDDLLDDYNPSLYVLGSPYLRASIGAICFSDSVSNKPSDAWDISANGDGSVWAWVTSSDQMSRSGSVLYDLIIAAEGRIKLNENAHALFAKYSNLKRIDFNDCVDTSAVSDMSYMFYDCSELTSLDVSFFHTENVTDMRSMFSGCYCLTSLNLSSFRTARVTNMSNMFSKCYDLAQLNVSSFDTSHVTDMQFMFYNCQTLTTLNLSSFDTSNVTSMVSMFNYCVSLPSLDLSSFDTAKATDLSAMFYECKKLSSITASNRFIINKDAETRNMFYGCPSDAVAVPEDETWGVMRDDDIVSDSDYRNSAKVLGSEYYRSQIRSIRFMDTLEGKPSDAWDVSASQNGSVWAWVTPAGTSSEDGLAFFDLVIAGDGGVKLNRTARRLFGQYVHLESIDFGDCVDTSGVQYMAEMFSDCSALKTLDLSCFDTSHVLTMHEMFSNCISLETLDLSSFNTAMLTDLSSMFYECESLTHLDLHHFDTSNVTNMGGLFMYCNSLTDVDLSSFKTHNVTIMGDMFYYCFRLSSLDLSSFDTSNVWSMYEMFEGCGVIDLDLSSFDTSNVTDMSWMFNDCSELKTLNLTSFDTSSAEDMYAMFNQCRSLEKILISEKFVICENNKEEDVFGECPIGSLSQCIFVKADADSASAFTPLPSPSSMPSIDQGALEFLSASDSDALFEQYKIAQGPYPEFSTAQNLALYTGPGYEYAPVVEDGQGLLIKTSRRITTFGTENGWHLMEYAVDGSTHQFGYINEDDFLSTPRIFSGALSDAQWPAIISVDTEVTDDPGYSNKTVSPLSKGMLVRFIHLFIDRTGQQWACVEAEREDGFLFRGFIPKDHLQLLADSSFPLPTSTPAPAFGFKILGKREAVDLIEQNKLSSSITPRIDESQRLPIYTGPGDEYMPVYQDNEIAHVKTERQLSAYGAQAGWQLVEYAISGGRHRYCYINENDIAGYSWFGSTELPHAQYPAVLLADIGVTDDPGYSEDAIYNLSAGTTVQFMFSQKDRNFKYWLCIEATTNDGQPFRGFVPMDALAFIRE